MDFEYDTIVIGAGLSGLSCAVQLHENGLRVLVVDAADAVGGRVRTDSHDGFLMDRGFQVFTDSYTTASKFLDLESLQLNKFLPGALVWKEGAMREVMDVFRSPLSLFKTAFGPVGNLRDKWLVGKLRAHVLSIDESEIWDSEDISTNQFLKDFGFSKEMIDDFFRGFYGGIFLEPELATSARMFQFTFRKFAQGNACLPAEGMEAIPRQLASRLPADCIRLGTKAVSIEENSVVFENKTLTAKSIVCAADSNTAAQLTGQPTSKEWRQTSCLYFSADQPPFSESLILLKGDRAGVINSVCVPSSISSSYAPAGKCLVSVSIVGDAAAQANLQETAEKELLDWFGDAVSTWTHLKTYRIPHALPSVRPSERSTTALSGSLFLCGDHTTNPSIDGAIRSGLSAATSILSAHGK
ncbi:MAG: hypothetical protein CMO55_27330 [Verrucomicrobiales bacterium]|nr:hypothetical protein [Verrucomicrobiales bacterium]